MLFVFSGIYLLTADSTSPTALSSVALEFTLIATVLEYLFLYKRMSRHDVISSLGLGMSRLSIKNIGIGILIFLVMFLIELSLGTISAATGTGISTNVQLLLASEPLWFYFFTFTITPICEEVFFRGLMMPRLGIFLSAIIFGLSHSSYDSTFGIDMIFAFIFAVIAGWALKKTKSLYPSIIAHSLVNILAVIAYLF